MYDNPNGDKTSQSNDYFLRKCLRKHRQLK